MPGEFLVHHAIDGYADAVAAIGNRQGNPVLMMQHQRYFEEQMRAYRRHHEAAYFRRYDRAAG